jgi:hypothetical protein
MKQTLLLLAATTLIFGSCTDKDNKHEKDNDGHGDKHCITVHKYNHKMHNSDDTSCNYIPIDSGNKMISSYLNSINYQQNDTDLYDLIYNADSLRSYLSDKRIVSIKFMFAHTLDYINSGGKDQYAGYQSGALTFVIAGYDSNSNYVFFYAPKSLQAMAMDHCQPCPHNCPTTGSAASDFLDPNTHSRK